MLFIIARTCLDITMADQQCRLCRAELRIPDIWNSFKKNFIKKILCDLVKGYCYIKMKFLIFNTYFHVKTIFAPIFEN